MARGFRLFERERDRSIGDEGAGINRGGSPGPFPEAGCPQSSKPMSIIAKLMSC